MTRKVGSGSLSACGKHANTNNGRAFAKESTLVPLLPLIVTLSAVGRNTVDGWNHA